MKKALFFVLAFVALAFAAEAQSPVRWRTSVRMSSPTEGEITIKALISEGWHLYGFDMPEGGPKSTRFDFSDCIGISLEGAVRPSEQPITQMDPLFGKKLSWWDRNVTFTQHFKVDNSKDARIKIEIYFMSCNGGTCTSPRTETITTTLPAYKPSELNSQKK